MKSVTRYVDHVIHYPDDAYHYQHNLRTVRYDGLTLTLRIDTFYSAEIFPRLGRHPGCGGRRCDRAYVRLHVTTATEQSTVTSEASRGGVQGWL